MAKFVLEIGTEELPARFLMPEEEAMATMARDALNEAGIAFGKITAMATPRRLALIVDDIANCQASREEVIGGPPVAVAYNENGEPTKALLGFMTSQNARLEDIYRLHTSKGEYTAVRKMTGGEPAQKALAAILPDIIARLPFAKRMRWGKTKFAYARPIHWILALLDDKIVEFSVGPIRSGRETRGHRVAGPGPFSVPDAESYLEILAKKGGIVLDGKERLKIIKDQGEKLASDVHGDIIWKNALLDEVAGLVEQPVPLLGHFDESYLEVPAEALLCSMEEHQKSFGLRGRDSKLLPYFLTVLNIRPLDYDLVRQGWERVLKARLEDARFFWKTDRAASFEQWLEKLEHVIFIGPLGTMREKASRLEKLCAWLASKLNLDPQDSLLAARAGELAKADLVSAMVGEFDTLQGIMGGIYAREAGEPEAVARAIQEQYLPAGPDSPLPATPLGAILSMADRADTLAGCFGLDKIPSGAADPNGLRRCALGIIRILVFNNWRLNVKHLFREALELYGERKWKLSTSQTLAKLDEFFKGRLKHFFLAQGYKASMVDAVLSSNSDDPADIKARLDALSAFSRQDQFEASIQLLKRVENIRKKADEESRDYDVAQMPMPEERELASSFEKLAPAINAALANSNYEKALALILELNAPVGNFFDKVMVMCEDAVLRKNRLKLLNAIGAAFAPMANFSSLQI